MVSWLRAALDRHEPFVLGELVIEPRDANWSLGVPSCDGSAARAVAGDPATLHTLAQSDGRGRYRPLSGARSLPRGWTSGPLDKDALLEAIEAIYPLATRHIEMAATGTLATVSLDNVLARQSGRYETAAALSPAGRRATVETVCGQCVRVPVWAGGDSSTDARGAVPCPEPCSIIVAFCREAVLWERERPARTEPDPHAGFAAFEEPGNALREAWLARRFPPSANDWPRDQEPEEVWSGVSPDSRD